MRGVTFIFCLQLATSACTHVDEHSRTSSAHENPDEPSVAASTGSGSPVSLNRALADRFPGATILSEAEFANSIVGRLFRYREVGGELIVERPKEVFLASSRYQIQWARSMSYGTYSIERGIVSIDCADCPYTFLNLGSERVFFRHQGKLFMANADGDGGAVELIPQPSTGF